MNAASEPRRRMQNAGRARLTIDEYLQIADAGVLDRFGRTELIGGEIFVVSPLYLPHARIHSSVYSALARSVADSRSGLEVLFGPTLSLGDLDAPLPDITILDLAGQSPDKAVPADAVRMVVEVAASTARYDLGRKRKLYAQSGIAEYWVVLVRKEQVQRFSGLDGGDYARCDILSFADRVDSVTLPGVQLPAGTLG